MMKKNGLSPFDGDDALPRATVTVTVLPMSEEFLYRSPSDPERLRRQRSQCRGRSGSHVSP